MTDLFISYSRKDKQFVQRLHEALHQRERDIWIDWEDIPLAVDWRAEIREGIETASAVTFVISPDFLSSVECGIELELAEELGKRLIPMYHRESDFDYVPPSLKALNWIYCREEDDFEQAVAGLISTIDADPNWLKAHTRLTRRAAEWELKNLNDSLLLRGDDLVEAEQMLSQTKKEPKLSELVGQYIVASRTSATRRQRNMLLAVTIGMVLAIILAGAAAYNYFVAEQERALATSRELIASAQSNLTSDPELSTLLALEALDYSTTAEVRTLLGQAVQSLNTQLFLPEHTGSVYPVAFSADSSWLLTFSYDGTASVWDAASGSELQTITYEGIPWASTFSPDNTLLAIVTFGDDETEEQDSIDIWEIASGNILLTIPVGVAVNNVAISPDNNRLASATDEAIIVYDLSSGEQILTIPIPAQQITFNPNGTILATNAEQSVTLHDVISGRELLSFSDAGLKDTNKLVFSPDSTRLATADIDSKSRIWDVETGEKIRELVGHSAGWVNDVVFSPDTSEGAGGQLLASAGDDRTVRLWNVETGDELFTFSGHTDRVVSVAFSPDGTRLLSGSDDTTARLWRTGQDILSGHTDWINWALYNANGDRLLTGSLDNTAKLWDVPTGKNLLTFLNDDYDFSPDGSLLALFNEDSAVEVRNARSAKLLFTIFSDPLIAFSPDSTRLAAAEFYGDDPPEGEIIITTADSGTPLLTISYDKPVSNIGFSPDGSSLFTISEDEETLSSEIVLWDAQSGDRLLTIPHPQPITWASFNADGTRLGGANLDDIEWDESQREAVIWNTASGEPVLRFPLDTTNSIALNQNRTRVATIHNDILRVWEVNSGQELLILPEQPTTENDRLILSPDGVRLAVTKNNARTVQVWDVDTGQQLMSYDHPGKINDVAFNSDATRLAAGMHDRTAIIWDVDTGQELLTLSGHTNAILLVLFSPDDRHLVTAGQDGTARLYILDDTELLQTARSRLSRWWTPQECRQYLHQEECPPDQRPRAEP